MRKLRIKARVTSVFLSLILLMSTGTPFVSALNVRRSGYYFNDFEDGRVVGIYSYGGYGVKTAIHDEGYGGSEKSFSWTESGIRTKVVDGKTTEEAVMAAQLLIRPDENNFFNATIPASALFKLNFKIKLAQVLTAGHITAKIKCGSSYYYICQEFDCTDTENWQNVELVYQNTSNSAISFTLSEIYFAKIDDKGSIEEGNYLTNYETTGVYGTRTYYIDEVELSVSYLNKESKEGGNLPDYYLNYEASDEYYNKLTIPYMMEIKNDTSGKVSLARVAGGAENSFGSLQVAVSDSNETILQLRSNGGKGNLGNGGVLKNGETYSFSLDVKLNQTLTSDCCFKLCAYNSKWSQVWGSAMHTFEEFDVSDTENWQRLSYSWLNDTGEDISLMYVRLVMSNTTGGGWTTSSTTDTIKCFIDNVSVSITSETETETTALKISNFSIDGTMLAGETISFNYDFSTANSGATDKSVIRLVTCEDYGNIGTLATVYSGQKMTVPENAENKELRFAVIPIDSTGICGETVMIDSPEWGAYGTKDIITLTAGKVGNDIEAVASFGSYFTSKFSDVEGVNLVVAAYGERNKMLGCKMEKKIPQNNVNHKVILSGINTDEDTVVKCFLWNDNTTQAPICTSVELKHKDLPNMSDCIRNEIYVDSDEGNDTYDGTAENPLKTIAAARDLSAKYTENMQGDLTIYIRGKHYLDETLTFNESHSGQNGNDVIYKSWDENAPAAITMAKEFTGFTLHDKAKNIWSVDIGDNYSRQAYFNGVKGIRARTVGKITGVSLYGVTTDEVTGEEVTILVDGNIHEDRNGTDSSKNLENATEWYFICDDEELLSYSDKDIEDLEVNIMMLFVHHRYNVSSITKNSDGKVKITMGDYFTNYAWMNFIDYWRDPTEKYPEFLENAYPLLDEPGEWYINDDEGKLYYIPREGESGNSLTCMLPIGERMISAAGTDYEHPISNITFENLIFEGTTWLRPDTMGGHGTAQNGWVSEGHAAWVADASVEFRMCKNITLKDNIFRRLGATGVEFWNDAQNIEIVGNEFYDISGSALSIDTVSNGHGDQNLGTKSRGHVTWCENIIVKNNYIHDIGTDYKSSSAIALGWPRNCSITHNEIANMPYGGIHIGYGWNNYDKVGSVMYQINIENNYIHDAAKDRMSDIAPIYVLGRSDLESGDPTGQINNETDYSVVKNNYIKNAWNCPYWYADQGASNWLVKNNVFDHSDVLEMEYNFDRDALAHDNHAWANGPGVWIKLSGNWSDIPAEKYEQYRTTTCDENGILSQTGRYQARVCDTDNVLVKDGNRDGTPDWPSNALAVINSAGLENEYKTKFSQRLATNTVFVALDRAHSYITGGGTTVDPKLRVSDEDGNFIPATAENGVLVDWWSTAPDGALTINSDNTITVNVAGKYELEAVTVVNGVPQAQHIIISNGNTTYIGR